MSRSNPAPAAPAWSRRHLLAACTGLALLTLGCAPLAHAEGRLVQVDIVDRDSGAPLRVWRDHGRPVVAGRPGARYAVRLTNRTGERVLAVVAIDGVNILTGETAASDQDGYVLGPWGSRPRSPAGARATARLPRSSSRRSRTRTPRAPAGRTTSA